MVEIARGGPSLAYENLQTLCRACHRAKTVRFLRTRPSVDRRGRAAKSEDDGPDWFPA